MKATLFAITITIVIAVSFALACQSKNHCWYWEENGAIKGWQCSDKDPGSPYNKEFTDRTCTSGGDCDPILFD